MDNDNPLPNFKDLGIIPQEEDNPFDNLDRANRLALTLKEAIADHGQKYTSLTELVKETEDKTPEEVVAILKYRSEFAGLLDTLGSIVDNVIKDYQLEVSKLNG